MKLDRTRCVGALPIPLLVASLLACGRTNNINENLAGMPDAYVLHDAMAYDAHIVPVDSGYAPPGHFDVLMQHNDPMRTGQDVSETVLTTSNVNVGSFGALFTLPVDGLIYAQPLIVTGYPLGDGGTHDLLIVATMHNSVYAFDANDGAELWHVNLGPSVPSSDIGQIINDAGQHQGTVNIQVEVGILATPVIDRDKGLIYLTRKDYTNQIQSYKLHVLSLATGKDMPGSPATINAAVPGIAPDANDAGVVVMDPDHTAQRPGLLLLNGAVYLGFASHEDWQPYHGWILGYTYAAGQLTQTAVWNASPDGKEGGLWNSGQGLLSDGESVYGSTSNGTVNAYSGGDSYGEAFLRLSPELEVQDYFTPVDYGTLNGGDIDLGSAGTVLIPGTSPLLMVGGGKEGILYVVDTTNMGKVSTVADDVLQEFHIPRDGGNGGTKSMYGAPVVWTGTATPYVYTWAVGDVIRRFPVSGGLLDLSNVVTSTVANLQIEIQDPAGNLAVSSNGGMPGTGIVWGTNPSANPDHTTVPGVFHAFDANTLKELWNSQQDAARDDIGLFAKFVPPTIANGKVYLATHAKKLIVYGLLGHDEGG